MGSSPLFEVIRGLLAQPTAPFHEDAVRTEIHRQLASCRQVQTTTDTFGNVIAHYQRGAAEARCAFVAHMDHPGFVGSEFLGGVAADYLAKEPPTRDFGAFRMWDLPACELRDGRIYSRACDDLIGCATIISMLLELDAREIEGNVYGLFTRAEEVGFVGAIEISRSGWLPREITIVSLETSSEKGGAGRMGAGVIVRVGDKTSVFDSAATAAFVEIAGRAGIPVQRCLMSGGTCEATAFQLFGYRCAGLCVALGNYHNCGPDAQIMAEFVALDDVAAMAALCVEIARCSDPFDLTQQSLRARLEKNAAAYANRFDT